MDLAVEFFSHLCGRDRCFVIDGVALPLCQRCLGLYLGVAATAVWIAAGRLWRRGLPPRGLLAVHGAVLLAALLGGLHVIDAGATWRLVCGLVSGYVFLVWLVTGAGHLWRLGRPGVAPPQHWRRGDTVGALVMIPLLVGFGVAFAAFLPPPRPLWIVASLVGLLALVVAAAWAVVAVVRWAFRRR